MSVRLAGIRTSVVAVSELFVVSGSGRADVTEAVLLRVVGVDGAVTVMSTNASPKIASEPRLQVTTPDA